MSRETFPQFNRKAWTQLALIESITDHDFKPLPQDGLVTSWEFVDENDSHADTGKCVSNTALLCQFGSESGVADAIQ